MFVSDNTLKSAKDYFNERLSFIFTPSELKSMWSQLICKRMRWSSSDLLLNQSERLSESDLLYVRGFVKGLLNQEPFQYLLGETTFFGLTLTCDSRALIPRPETEELVDWISSTVDSPKNLIDLCTGNGCIALALKSIYSSCRVSALDYSEQALSLAKHNAEKVGLNIEFYLDDVLNLSPLFTHSTNLWDIIVSNPPYIPKSEKVTMSAHILNHEPAMALFVADSDPIFFYKKIIDYAGIYLAENGYLFFELHESYGEDVKLYLESRSFQQIEMRKDLQGKSRMLKAQKV